MRKGYSERESFDILEHWVNHSPSPSCSLSEWTSECTDGEVPFCLRFLRDVQTGLNSVYGNTEVVELYVMGGN